MTLGEQLINREAGPAAAQIHRRHVGLQQAPQPTSRVGHGVWMTGQSSPLRFERALLARVHCECKVRRAALALEDLRREHALACLEVEYGEYAVREALAHRAQELATLETEGGLAFKVIA